MSSKRRKLIQQTKPPTDIAGLVSDGVKKVVQTSGIQNPSSSSASSGSGGNNSSSATSLDDIASNIAGDVTVQSSYSEAMRATVRERLTNDPDFDDERFPNCSKYFKK